jgi:hypothetical protein
LRESCGHGFIYACRDSPFRDERGRTGCGRRV